MSTKNDDIHSNNEIKKSVPRPSSATIFGQMVIGIVDSQEASRGAVFFLAGQGSSLPSDKLPLRRTHSWTSVGPEPGRNRAHLDELLRTQAS